ncbi:uncharacterized protein LOC107265492 [Cephus cinctus]|uniref:Uncharacterized protein LOC107265492 n=1 Tax=Cephus cinctus TaxID=211228 RepID=A0AAJ7FGC4_CEPCN|nr:uncharacterized protein LOC107265492 [Cephus cinctus]
MAKTLRIDLVLLVLASVSRMGAAIVTPMLAPIFERIGDRDLINRDVLEVQLDISKFSKVTPCLRELYPFMSRRENVSVFLSNVLGDRHYFRLFLTSLQPDVAFFVRNDRLPETSAYNRSSNAFILFRDADDLSEAINLIDLCAPRCNHVIILTTVYEEDKDFLNDVYRLVQFMWQQMTVKLVIVGLVGERALVAGSLGFERGKMPEPSGPVILAECWEGVLKRREEIFGNYETRGMKIGVGFFEREPFVYAAKDNGTEEIRRIEGIEGQLVESIASNMGITLVRTEFTLENGTDVFEKIVEINKNNSSYHVLMSGLHWKIDKHIEYSVFYDVSEVVWTVPERTHFSLLAFVTPFADTVWIAFGGLFVFTVILRCLLLRKLSFISVLSLILGVALPRQPDGTSERIQFLSWTIFGYITSQMYLASMASQLMKSSHQEIGDMEELLSRMSDLKLGGMTVHRDLFQNEKDDSLVDDLISGKNNSIALVTELSAASLAAGISYGHIVRERIAHYALCLAVLKGVPYMDKFNSKITHLVEGGFIKYWWRSIGQDRVRRYDEDETLFNLGIKELSPCFLLLFMGHSLGLLVLILEIILINA